MKTVTAILGAALLTLAAPAFAQNNPATSGPGANSSQPGGAPGATGGTDPKNGAASMTEGRASVTDPDNTRAMKNGYKGTNGNTNNNMAPGGGPGEAGGTSK